MRAQRLWLTDQDLSRAHGGLPLVGVDEVGRGCLAGPVLAAAVLSPAALPASLGRLNDSKKLSPGVRRALRAALRAEGVAYGLGWASAAEIDSLNILQATFLAQKRAVEALLENPGLPKDFLVLVDGDKTIPGLARPQACLVGGDSKSCAVAAASVLAKTARDRWMAMLDARHPGYGFAGHKGYGTPIHLKALQELGASPLHRRSFAPVTQVPLPL